MQKISGRVIIGYVLGAFSIVILAIAAFQLGSTDSDHWRNILIILFGGLLGWCTGILATPKDTIEENQFSTYKATISTFLSGFVLAKVDRIFESKVMTPIIFTQLLIFGSSFLLGTLFTFIGRLYIGTLKTEINPASAKIQDQAKAAIITK